MKSSLGELEKRMFGREWNNEIYRQLIDYQTKARKKYKITLKRQANVTNKGNSGRGADIVTERGQKM